MAFQKKVISRVLVPKLALHKNREYCFRFDTEIDQNHNARVTILDTDRQNDMNVPSSVVLVLNKSYPSRGYVGKAFAMTIHTKAGARDKGVPVSLDEIALDTGEISQVGIPAKNPPRKPAKRKKP